MQHALDVLVALAGRHPTAALALVAFVAFGESVAILGTLVPAAIVMFGAGALVGQGTLELGWTLAAAAAGAIGGDSLSYELGRHQQARIRAWAPFRRRADHIAKAEGLIARHGAAGVVIARFTGPVRAFVPLLAGFARMPAGKFYATNAASALLWAPAHVLPGVVFGASLHLAQQASGRLAMLIMLLAALLWGAVWLVRFTIRTVVPLSRALRDRALRAAGTRAIWWARVLRLLLDPERPGSEALLVAFVALLASMWLFLGIVEDVVASDPLVTVDLAVFTFLQQLRTQPVDRLMVGITEMGSVGVILPLVIAIASWLAMKRCWRSAGYWIATTASAELMVQVLKRTLGRHRPIELYQGVEQFSFPSGHATLCAVVLAYLAFLLTRGQSRRWRFSVAALAAVYMALVGFSRLYLGAHWLSDVVGGFSSGFAAVALSAMVYTQHRVQEDIQPKRMALVAGATILVAAGLWQWWQAPADLQRYSIRVRASSTTLQAWAAGEFRSLPPYRQEIAGERKEAFTLQVACPETVLRDAIGRAGWAPAPELSLASVLQTIVPNPAIGQLPVLPRYDGGNPARISVVQTSLSHESERRVMRLWKSGWELTDGEPIWYGAYTREVLVRSNYGILREEARPADEFSASLVAVGLRRVETNPLVGVRAPELWTCGGS